MTDPAIPPEAQAPSGRTPESQPTTAPNPSSADPNKDPTDAGTVAAEVADLPIPPG